MLPKKVELRIVGKTVFTTINRKAVKVNLEKEGKDKLKAMVESFNKKPSDFWLNKILKVFEPKVVAPTKEKTAKKVAKKELKEVKKEKALITKKAKAGEELANVVNTIADSAAEKVAEKTEQIKEKIQGATPSSNVGHARKGEY